jgi:hypothetical protein
MEAVKYRTNVRFGRYSALGYTGEKQAYKQAYRRPVVLGHVQTFAAPRNQSGAE